VTSIANAASVGRQALRRSVNERIRAAVGESAQGSIELFCECGRIRCSDRLQLAVGEYDSILAAAGRYVVLPGHQDDGAERPVDRRDDVVVVDRSRRA
jgi:hypothetical protein